MFHSRVNHETLFQFNRSTTLNTPTTTHIKTRLTYREFLLNYIGKPLAKRTLATLCCDEIAKATELLYPYFGLNRITALAFQIVGTSIVLGITIPIQQNALRTFVDAAFRDHHAFDAYKYSLLIFTFTKLLIPIIHSLNAISCKELRETLTYKMRDDLGSHWLSTKTYVGYLKTEAGKNIIDPVDDIAKKTSAFCENLINLSNDRISILSHFVGALYSLYSISTFLEISLLGLSFNLPYLVLIAIFYGYIYNISARWAHAMVKQNVQEKSIATDKFTKQTSDSLAEAERESIAFLDGENFEIDACKEKNKNIHVIDQASLRFQALLSWLNKIMWEWSEALGIITQPLTGAPNPADALSAGKNFMHIVNLAGFWNLRLDPVKNLEQCTNNLQTIIQTTGQYQKLTDVKGANENKITYSYYSDANRSIPYKEVEINLKIPTQDQTETIEINFTLRKGKIYRLVGPNGAGKTTLLKLLKGNMDPTLGSGHVKMPPNHLFLPNKPYILKGNSYSLMQTILYPSMEKATNEQINLAQRLLKNLLFDIVIDNLATVGIKDWSTNLSSGQQQKIAILNCLLKDPKPDVIFLDEPFSAMDSKSREASIQLLHKFLPNVIILYIEHKHNDNNAYNEGLQIIQESF